MKLLSKPEVEAIEKELNSILSIGYLTNPNRAMELMLELDNSYHTNLNVKLVVIRGGK